MPLLNLPLLPSYWRLMLRESDVNSAWEERGSAKKEKVFREKKGPGFLLFEAC